MINNTVFVAQVSKQAKEFLEFVFEEPLLDVQQLNPCLYEHCEALAAILKLRQQLQSLRAYLFSCRATVAEDLRRRWAMPKSRNRKDRASTSKTSGSTCAGFEPMSFCFINQPPCIANQQIIELLIIVSYCSIVVNQ